jgi:hypothetical protein
MPPDDLTTLMVVTATAEVTKAVGKLVVRNAIKFFKRIKRNWSARNERQAVRVLRTVAQAQDMTFDLPLNPPPDKLLVQILAYAGLEDEPELQRKYAALLANSAVNPDAVHPSFPQTLSQLTAPDVRVLDWLADQPRSEDGAFKDSAYSAAKVIRATAHDIITACSISSEEFVRVAGNLQTQGLVEAGYPYVVSRSGGSRPSSRIYSDLTLMSRGWDFVMACRPPKSRATEPLPVAQSLTITAVGRA